MRYDVTMAQIPLLRDDASGTALRVHSPYFPCHAPSLPYVIQCDVLTESE